MTIDSDRGSIDALLAKYTYHHDTRDLYVEGETDKNIYDWYLRESGRRDVTVFDIGSIDVPQEVVSSFGLRGGNRDRVTALSLILDDEFPTGLPHVRCVVDSDFDFILPTRRDSRHLLHTDYTSVELYAYSREKISKLLTLSFGFNESEAQLVYESMSCALRELFLVRAANQRLDWRVQLVRFDRYLSLAGPSIVFDKDEFVTQRLIDASKSGEHEIFESVYSALSSTQLSDDRERIRGSDFVEVFGWYLNQRRRSYWHGYRRCSRSALPILLTSLDTEELSSEFLFSQLDRLF